MKTDVLKSLFLKHKELYLYHRYITNNTIQPLLDVLGDRLKIEVVGVSVLNKPIHTIQIGTGEKRILMWSQMHGNESTTTKAIFDLVNTLIPNNHLVNHILEACTICIIPILNPDGAEAYTRFNANEVDLNRDAQDLTQPESLVLKDVFDKFKPHYCYNLHGQRTIFSAGETDFPATVSFLAPAQDQECSITSNRKIAMEIIAVMDAMLQKFIPNQVGVYDDAFNLNCVGDTFQSSNVPTILFEAGHYPHDYAREKTREYIYIAILTSLDYIALNKIQGENYSPYFTIPENGKCFLDIIIRHAKMDLGYKDIGIQYQERLIDGVVAFIPKVVNIEDLSMYYAHKEFNANGFEVLGEDGNSVKVDSEIGFVLLNNKKIPLLLE